MKYKQNKTNFYRPRHKAVYLITHTPSGHFYVGQSGDFSSRIGTHISNILLGKWQISDTDLSHYAFSILQNCDALTDAQRLQAEKGFIRELSASYPLLCLNVAGVAKHTPRVDSQV